MYSIGVLKSNTKTLFYRAKRIQICWEIRSCLCPFPLMVPILIQKIYDVLILKKSNTSLTGMVLLVDTATREQFINFKSFS